MSKHSYVLALSPELPPAFFLDLLFPGLEGKLADTLSELRHMAAKE